MDRMLHRGPYAKIQQELGDYVPEPPRRRLNLGRIIGVDENFTLGDKWIAYGLFGYSMLFCAIMIVGTVWNLISPWPAEVWSEFWHVVAILIPIFLGVVMTVWFTWGGILDSVDLFRRLRTQVVNPVDNGAVVGHQNLDESVLPDADPPRPPPSSTGQRKLPAASRQ